MRGRQAREQTIDWCEGSDDGGSGTGIRRKPAFARKREGDDIKWQSPPSSPSFSLSL